MRTRLEEKPPSCQYIKEKMCPVLQQGDNLFVIFLEATQAELKLKTEAVVFYSRTKFQAEVPSAACARTKKGSQSLNEIMK